MDWFKRSIENFNDTKCEDQEGHSCCEASDYINVNLFGEHELYLKDLDTGDWYIEIKYCPWCGEKLEV